MSLILSAKKEMGAVTAGLRVISSGRVFKDGVLGQGVAAKQIPGAFQVIDAKTGKAIKGLRFKRVGTDLIAELDGATVAIVDGFFESEAVLVTEEGCLSGRTNISDDTYVQDSAFTDAPGGQAADPTAVDTGAACLTGEQGAASGQGAGSGSGAGAGTAGAAAAGSGTGWLGLAALGALGLGGVIAAVSSL